MRLAEQAKVAKAKAEEQKTREKKAKDLILEKHAIAVALEEKRKDAKDKVQGYAKQFNSKMKERDQKMQAAAIEARKIKEMERRAL